MTWKFYTLKMFAFRGFYILHYCIHSHHTMQLHVVHTKCMCGSEAKVGRRSNVLFPSSSVSGVPPVSGLWELTTHFPFSVIHLWHHLTTQLLTIPRINHSKTQTGTHDTQLYAKVTYYTVLFLLRSYCNCTYYVHTYVA